MSVSKTPRTDDAAMAGDDALARAMLDDGIIAPARRHSEASRRYHADDEADWSNEYLRENWIDWRAVVIGIIAALAGGVLIAGACLLLTGAVFGFNPVELAADIRSVLR